MHSSGKKIWLRRISNGPDTDKAKEYIVEMIKKNFMKKGEEIVKSNINALET